MAKRATFKKINTNWPVSLYFCPDKESFADAHRVLKMPGSAERRKYAAALTSYWPSEDGSLNIVVSVGAEILEKRPFRETISSIMHECVHVWQLICEEIGEATPHAAKELEAYGIQRIFEDIFGAYIDHFGVEFREKKKHARA